MPAKDEIRIKEMAKYISDGMSPKDAAVKAGYGEKYSKNNALKIAKRPDLLLEINAIRERENLIEAAKNGDQIDRARIFEELRSIIFDRDKQDVSRLRAIELINKMMGWNEPDKLEVAAVIHDDLETVLKKAERVLVEHGYKVIHPPKDTKFTIKTLEQAK